MSKTGNSAKKILIVKIGAIGDIVMSLSMLKAIDIKYPGSHITWLCGTAIKPFLESVPRIDKLVVLNEKRLLAGGIIKKILETVKTWFKLFLKYYDIIVVAYRDPHYKLLTVCSLRNKTATFSRQPRQNSIVPYRYLSIEYARLILETDDWQMNEIGFPDIRICSVKVIDEELIKLDGKKVIINAGGAKNIINGGEVRRWEGPYYAKTAERLINDGANIILTGAKEDLEVLQYFEGLPVINFIGRTSLTDLLYLMEQCDLLITHDTGIMHLAKLTPIKVVALFGPTHPLNFTGKFEQVYPLWLGSTLPCSPCYNGKSFAECSNNVCMKNISVDLVCKTIYEKIPGFHDKKA